MKRPIDFATGPMISTEQDFIFPLNPIVYEIDEAFTKWRKSLNDFSTEMMQYVGDHECVNNNTQSTEFVQQTVFDSQYKIHESYNHKCYPINTGISGSNGSGITDMDADKDRLNAAKMIIGSCTSGENTLVKFANRFLFERLLCKMAEMQYVDWKYISNLAVLLTDIVEYNDRFKGVIVSVALKTKHNPNTNKSFPVFEISSFTDIAKNDRNTFDLWCNLLNGTRIDLVQKVMTTGIGNMHDCYNGVLDKEETNWCFQFNQDSITGNTTLVLSSCKEISSGKTYGLTILNKSFVLNTASNVKMQVPKGTDFIFTATIAGSILSGISVSDANYCVNTIDIGSPDFKEQLSKYGIAITSSGVVSNGARCTMGYTFTIADRNTDLRLCLESYELAHIQEFLPIGHSDAVSPSKYTNGISTGRRTGLTGTDNCNKYTHVMSAHMILRFPISVSPFSMNVKAYALPMGEFSNPDIDLRSAKEINIASCVPAAGCNNLDLIFNINNIDINCLNGIGRLLMRIVFNAGSLKNTVVTEDGANVVVNYQFASQFEIDMNTGAVLSCYSGYTYGLSGTTTWHPPIPQAICASALGVLEFEYGKFTLLNPLSHLGTLSLKETVDIKDVPLGIPESVNYNSVMLNNPIDDMHYFAIIKIPYPKPTVNPGISTPVMEFATFASIKVTSEVRQLFSLGCESCGYDEVNHIAIYNRPRLVYCEDGYVLLPVLFDNIDEIHIEVEDIPGNPKVEYVISVNLGELPTPEEPDTENPDGSENETPGSGEDNKGENGDGSSDVVTPETPDEKPDSGDTGGEDNKEGETTPPVVDDTVTTTTIPSSEAKLAENDTVLM